MIEDENLKKKTDEVQGEVQYNKIIPRAVHLERNAFVNRNTADFLRDLEIDLTKADVLIIGCSMTELDFFARKSKYVTALDIVPAHARNCLKVAGQRNIQANWVCGDGECLPFDAECFDAVIIRQTLHHMLKYYSAICEFFRVCKRGGSVFIIDEPFSPPDTDDVLLKSIPGNFSVYEELEFASVRKKLHIPEEPNSRENKEIDLRLLEAKTGYIEPDSEIPETFLADKYHSFSILNCILALRMHTEKIRLHWPQEVAWTDESGDVVKFCHGPNPNYKKSLLDKLNNPGNVSIAAKKTSCTTVFRDRAGLKALPVDEGDR